MMEDLETRQVLQQEFGGVKAVGGLVEMTVGAVGGAATSWTGVGAF